MEPLCLFGGALGVMLLGLAGAFLPLVPGVPLVWVGVAGYGILDGFQHLSVPAFVVLTLLGIAGTTAEVWATQVGARAGGASGWSALAGTCLGALALLFFSLPIALLAALGSVFGIEWLRRGDVETAARGSGGWLAGWALSAVAQFAVSLFMILFFVWNVVF
jgi:uncharacterized protein YqgC (DUF456 family)